MMSRRKSIICLSTKNWSQAEAGRLRFDAFLGKGKMTTCPNPIFQQNVAMCAPPVFHQKHAPGAQLLVVEPPAVVLPFSRGNGVVLLRPGFPPRRSSPSFPAPRRRHRWRPRCGASRRSPVQPRGRELQGRRGCEPPRFPLHRCGRVRARRRRQQRAGLRVARAKGA